MGLLRLRVLSSQRNRQIVTLGHRKKDEKTGSGIHSSHARRKIRVLARRQTEQMRRQTKKWRTPKNKGEVDT